MNSTNVTSGQTLVGEPALFARAFGWLTLSFLLAFMINNVLSIGFDVPSGSNLITDPSIINLIQPS